MWNCQALCVRYKFSKIIFVESLNFFNCQQMLSCFPWSNRLTYNSSFNFIYLIHKLTTICLPLYLLMGSWFLSSLAITNKAAVNISTSLWMRICYILSLVNTEEWNGWVICWVYVFHNGCIILHFHYQYIKLPVPLHASQHFV